ncbi:hypothetical protein FB468_1718 [Leucobacter komagatae]|uniref:Uncharacterized protein n=1 Tax=Leucobacter komagatae TaxID=55969 RepID=A0A542Y6G3_9MICO|nr:hypothetical protein FB468_1718 [Leucobacter komagatae]
MTASLIRLELHSVPAVMLQRPENGLKGQTRAAVMSSVLMSVLVAVTLIGLIPGTSLPRCSGEGTRERPYVVVASGCTAPGEGFYEARVSIEEGSN